MTSFTVWKFDDPDRATEAAHALERAAADGVVKVLDHAVVRGAIGTDQPTPSHGHDETKHGAGWGALWGLLVGTLFFVPVVGGVAGAALGALRKGTREFGGP